MKTLRIFCVGKARESAGHAEGLNEFLWQNINFSRRRTDLIPFTLSPEVFFENLETVEYIKVGIVLGHVVDLLVVKSSAAAVERSGSVAATF